MSGKVMAFRKEAMLLLSSCKNGDFNAVFCPLAMVDRGVFEQEGWHRDADGTVSGVVYNEMQGALASPDAQLQNALQRAMFPDTAYGFVSGGVPASIPALTYEKYQRVYRRHYSADNCCITLYGKMDMADKLARQSPP